MQLNYWGSKWQGLVCLVVLLIGCGIHAKASVNLVQVAATTPQGQSSSVAVSYARAQIAGNLNIVVVGWNDTTAKASSVSDTRGNVYSLAAAPLKGTRLTQAIYYATNIASGSNTVKVGFSPAAADPDIRIFEYTGLSTASPLDATTGASGTSANGAVVRTGTVSTTASGELIFAAGITSGGYTNAGTSLTAEVITHDGSIGEDETVSQDGTYAASAVLGAYGRQNWILQMVTMKAVGGSVATVAVSLSPDSTEIATGQSKQFTATVTGTSNKGVTWNANFGRINSSGLYTAPNSQITDTVSATSVADPTQTARATAIVDQATSAGVYTIKSQEPITQEQYQGSIITTPLPSTAEEHCLGDVRCSESSPDKKIVNCIFGGNCANGSGGSETDNAYQRIAYDPADAAGGTGAAGTYYASCSDPIYKVVNLANRPPAANNPTNQYFHIPKSAAFGTSAGGDNFLFVWDQCTNGSAGTTTHGGRRLSDYEYTSAGLKTLPACTCTTEECANSTASCHLSMNYADYSYPLNDSSALNEGLAYVSTGAASQVAFLRGNELAGGVINHAIWVNTSCTASGPVFPATGQTLICHNQTNRPHPGYLFKIASSYNCNNVNPKELRAFCHAVQTYGAYLTDTSGPASGSPNGIWPSRIEGGVAYQMAGIGMPGLQSLKADENGSTVRCSDKSINGTPTYCSVQFFNLADLVGGNNLEIIDPCIPLHMAGKPGGCAP